MITHITAGETIIAMQERNTRLCNELHATRAALATVTATALRLPSTDLAPAEVATCLRLGCPNYGAVAAELVRLLNEERTQARVGMDDDFMVVN